MNGTAIVIKADGSITHFKFEGISEDDLFQWAKKNTGFNGEAYLQRVSTRGLPPDHCFLVDEDGRLNELPMNPRASRMHGGFIMGDAVILGTKPGLDGLEFCGCSEAVLKEYPES